jgi:hypothetical protein
MNKENNRHKRQLNSSKRGEGPKYRRLRPTVGEPWPEATEVKPNRTGPESVRGSVLVGLVFLTSALLIGLAGYAFINRDDRMILEILGFVLMFLSGAGGWAIGRSMT